MKTKRIQSIFLWSMVLCFFVLVLHTSCSNNDSEDLDVRNQDKREIKVDVFISTDVQSKVITDLDKSFLKSRFEKGDAIGVFAVKHGDVLSANPTDNYINNGKLVFDGTNWKWQAGTGNYYPEKNEFNLDFYAYYPYMGTPSTSANSFLYDAAVENNDLMMAEVGTSTQNRQAHDGINSDTVIFTFNHLLSLVQVDLSGADLMSDSEVIINGVITDGTFNLIARSFIIGSNVQKLKMKNDKGYFRAYLPPKQVISSSETKPLFDINHVGQMYQYKETITTTMLEQNDTHEYLITPKKPTDNTQDWPNAYVVKKGDVLFIPVAKPYNVWANDSHLASNQILTGTQTAELVWMDRKNLIVDADANNNVIIKDNEDDPQYSSIKVQTEELVGNAVVALKVGSDIVWSWHVWVVDDKPGEIVYAPSGQVFMDVNLGGTSTAKGDVNAVGLYYQWGRKDPFVGVSAWPATSQNNSTDFNYTIMYDGSGAAISVSLHGINTLSGPITIDDAIRNPDKFINVAAGVNNNDWIINSPQDDLWSKSSTSNKSVYDPCPRGWRVPEWKSGGTISPWYDFNSLGNTSGNGNASSPFIWELITDNNFGGLLYGNYFPAGGARTGESYGDFWRLKGVGLYWTSESPAIDWEEIPDKSGNWIHHNTQKARNLYFEDKLWVSPSSYTNKGTALSIRCAKI